MKICLVTTNFPRYLGDGEGTFIWEAARSVAKLGHQVRVIAQHSPNIPTREWMEDIEVIRPRYWWPESREILRKEAGGLPIILKKSWLARFQMIPFIIVHAMAVARYARDCDVIHAQWTLSAGVAWLSRVIHSRPIFVTLRGSDIFQVTRSRLLTWLTRFVLRRCDHISAISQALADSTAAIDIPPSAISIIPSSGVDLNRFVPITNSRESLILYVGSLITRKGVVYLLEAMSQITRAYPSFRLFVVGEGPERSSLEKKTADMGLTERVTFTGRQPSDQVCQRIQRAKLLVLPSIEEGIGYVLLEALACGTPIVASRVGGIPDVVTPEVGLLVPPANSDLLAEAVSQLLGDDKLWGEMSESARTRAEKHYGSHQIAAQYAAIYKEIAD